jgi:putative cell wall-binding protein
MLRTTQNLLITLLTLVTAVLFAPAALAVTATADTTAPGLPVDVKVRPSTVTTINQFIITYLNPEDESGIDRVHYTLDVAPTSNADGEDESTESSEAGTEEFLVLSDITGEHTVYIWLEDVEGNADYTKTAVVKIYSEGSPDDVVRVGARDRYESSVEVAKKVYPAALSAKSAVLVNGERAVDALGAVPLAVQAGAPILFTKKDFIPDSVWSEIQRAVPKGATIYLIGGSSAIDDNQSAFLVAQGYVVKRVSGATRVETAVAIAETLVTLRKAPNDIVFLVNGTALADGLSVAPAANRHTAPVLLTNTSDVPQVTLEYLKATGLRVIYIIGGNSVIDGGVVQELLDAGIFAFRVGGQTRYETSETIASTFFGDTIRPVFGLANGDTIIDSLSAGVHMSMQEGPVLLIKESAAETVCLATARYLSRNAKEIEGGYAYGGSSVIADATIDLVEDLISGKVAAGCS